MNEPQTYTEGTLWVSKDLSLYSGTGYARDFCDIELVCGERRVRHYRKLDKEWYLWIYTQVKKIHDSLLKTCSKTFVQMQARLKEIRTIAIEWWGQEEVERIEQTQRLPTTYPVPGQIAKTPQPRSKAIEVIAIDQPECPDYWTFDLKMKHARHCANLLSDRHNITWNNGHLSGPKGMQEPTIIRLAEEISAEVSAKMRGIKKENAA
jgi:hypothetical protein